MKVLEQWYGEKYAALLNNRENYALIRNNWKKYDVVRNFPLNMILREVIYMSKNAEQ